MEAFQFDLISDEVAQAIDDLGYSEATPIQAAAIPSMMAGRDIIGQAQTGTGKTAAFGIPLIEKLDLTSRDIQALVLCPTRELALQVAGEIKKFGRYKRMLRVLPVYGGQPIERQLRDLREGVQVVVGTPGRVMDHMRRGSISFENVKLVVLDEADEMLDMGFRDDIEEIVSKTPSSRQTALFSATMPREIIRLSRKYMVSPEHIAIEKREMTVESVSQVYYCIRPFHKTELLARLLIRDSLGLTLVFVATKRGVEEVVTELTRRGFSAAGLHGDMRQIERDAIMGRFRNGSISILVATDVAARGLDIDNIDAVINYDIPQDVEYYVHRIGRTGRAGREGRAYTFVAGRETTRMWEFRKMTGAKIVCEQPPTAEQVKLAQAEKVLLSVTERADQAVGENIREMSKKLLESTPADQAVEILLNMLVDSSGASIIDNLDLSIPVPAPAAERPPAARSYDRARNAPDGGYRHRGNDHYSSDSGKRNNRTYGKAAPARSRTAGR